MEIRTTLAMEIQCRVKKKGKVDFCALKCVKVLRTLFYFLMYLCVRHAHMCVGHMLACGYVHVCVKGQGWRTILIYSSS